MVLCHMPVFSLSTEKPKRHPRTRNLKRLALYVLLTLTALYVMVVAMMLISITDYTTDLPETRMGVSVPEQAVNIHAFTLLLPGDSEMSYLRFDVPGETLGDFLVPLCRRMGFIPVDTLSALPDADILNVFVPGWWQPEGISGQCRLPERHEFVNVWLQEQDTDLYTVYLDLGFATSLYVPSGGRIQREYLIR